MMTEQEKWELEHKDEIINALQSILRGEIIEEGRWNTLEGKWEINYSSILTRLIQEAGRWCNNYASDLFIHWESIKEKIDNGTMSSCSYVFGFRESGVDGWDRHEKHKYDENYYRAVWTLDITTIRYGKIMMHLHK